MIRFGNKYKRMQMSQLSEISIILKAHKKAVKTAIETAARTNTSLVSCKNGKVKIEKPKVKFMGYARIDPPKKKVSSVAKKSRAKK